METTSSILKPAMAAIAVTWFSSLNPHSSFRSLRERNHQWGLRELNHVTAIAAKAGFNTENVVSMPANNLTLVFQRA